MSYSVKIILDSINDNNQRLTTIEATYPRIIHSELMTHRVMSRNAASSRAIPVKKILEKVLTDPFVPSYWGQNQSGMQASNVLNQEEQNLAIKEWLAARDSAYEHASKLANNLNVHKQLANRILEPFSWITVIITATDWQNFFKLRCNPASQPEFQTLANMIKLEFKNSNPKFLKNDEWHLPYIYSEDLIIEKNIEELKKISTARCARVSYLTHDGKRDHNKDLELHNRLLSEGHMSPFEHIARPAKINENNLMGNFRGWIQYRKLIPNESAQELN